MSKRFWNAINWLTPAIGETPYWVWEEGIIPEGPGAYATNRPVPSIAFVKGEPGIFCAGVANLILRHAGKRVPSKGDLRYDGGVAAYFRGALGDGYYTGYDEDFDLKQAKRWANKTGTGVLIGRGYFGMDLADQGHVAILLPEYTDGLNYVLQSFGGYEKWPGLNWSSTIEQSHDGGYYTRMVHPKNWLDYSGDEF